MKKLILLLAVLPLFFGCSNKTNENVALQEENKIPNIKESYEVKYLYKFGECDTINGDTLYITKYDYADSLLIKEILYDKSGEIELKTVYTYIDNIQIDSVYKSDGLFSYSKHYKDNLDRDTLELRYSFDKEWALYGKQELSGKTTIQYDNAGLKHELIEYYFSDDFTWKHERIRINDNPEKQIIQEWNLRDNRFLVMEDTIWIKNGQINRIQSIKKNIIESDCFYKNGRINECIYYRNGEPDYKLKYMYF